MVCVPKVEEDGLSSSPVHLFDADASLLFHAESLGCVLLLSCSFESCRCCCLLSAGGGSTVVLLFSLVPTIESYLLLFDVVLPILKIFDPFFEHVFHVAAFEFSQQHDDDSNFDFLSPGKRDVLHFFAAHDQVFECEYLSFSLDFLSHSKGAPLRPNLL